MTGHHSTLDNTLTPAEPLGPNQHDRIKDKYIEELTYHKISIFSDLKNKPHMLIIGRKGAGKTAIISEILLELKKEEHKKESREKNHLRTSSQHNLPAQGLNYVIGVKSWERFLQIVRNVNSQFYPGEIINEQIPSEYFKKIWYEMLWDEIFQYFYNFAQEEDSREQLRPVYDYFNVDGFFTGTPRKQAEKIFDAAITSILGFLESRKAKLYFLFDSLDEYPIRNPTWLRTLVGLFQGLTKVSDDSSRIIITFCIPEEIEGFLTSASSNLLKDFSSSLRIKWKPVDLIRIVAHRLKFSARENDPQLFKEIRDLNFIVRDDLHKLFDLVLPLKMVCDCGR